MKELPKKDKCYFCKCDVSYYSEIYLVEKAMKPKGSPHRWKVIGYACDSCGEKENLRIE